MSQNKPKLGCTKKSGHAYQKERDLKLRLAAGSLQKCKLDEFLHRNKKS